MDKSKYEELIISLREKANNGDVMSMKLLGDALYQGPSGEEKNHGAAFPYWYKAAKNGEKSLFSKVGIMLFSGDDGVTQNMEEGLRFLNAAADDGDVYGQYYLGLFYESGVEDDDHTILQKDIKLAEKYYRMAALQNFDAAQYNLGKLLISNRQPGDDESLHWLCCAYINGNEDAIAVISGYIENADPADAQVVQGLIQDIKAHGITYKLKTNSSANVSANVSSRNNSGYSEFSVNSDSFDYKRYLQEVVELEKRIYIQEETISELDQYIQSLCVSSNITRPKPKAEYDNNEWIGILVGGAIFIGIGFLMIHCGSGCMFSCTRDLVSGGFSTIAFIIAALLIILGLRTALANRREMQQNQDDYYDELSQYEADTTADKERIKKEKKERERLTEQRELLYAKYEESCSLRDELYSLNVIFPKYRNLVAVCSFYEYFMSGRCTQLEGHEGAYNIFENEVRLNLIILKLDDIIDHLDRIEQNQYMLYQAINEGNQKIDKLIEQTKEISSKLDYISDQSAIAAQNTEWAAQELKTIKWLEIIRR